MTSDDLVFGLEGFDPNYCPRGRGNLCFLLAFLILLPLPGIRGRWFPFHLLVLERWGQGQRQGMGIVGLVFHQLSVVTRLDFCYHLGPKQQLVIDPRWLLKMHQQITNIHFYVLLLDDTY